MDRTNIKYMVMDVDGSLTDGKIYMGNSGEVMKAFSIKDGYVFAHLLPQVGIIPVIITARESNIVLNRCKELGIDKVFQGRCDKLDCLKEVVSIDGFNTVAYFGDDILDLKVMEPVKEAGGIAACPADAVREVKAVADYVCINRAGEGALREFAEWLVSDRSDESEVQHRVEKAVKYLKEVNIAEADVGKRVDVDDDFYYSIQSYDTKPAEECKLESHRKYIDIQIMVSGEESMDLADISRLSLREEYNEEKDVVFWNVPIRMSKTTLLPGDCIVLYPETAHRGAQNLKGTKPVLKIVGKVKI